jgi:putative addiction module component (TIGR02574 family)
MGGMVDPGLLSQAKQLDVADRVELINELWDSIDQNDLPVTPEIAALIDERLREADARPLEGRPWEEVEAELRARLP